MMCVRLAAVMPRRTVMIAAQTIRMVDVDGAAIDGRRDQFSGMRGGSVIGRVGRLQIQGRDQQHAKRCQPTSPIQGRRHRFQDDRILSLSQRCHVMANKR